ncbi:hypothetical protein ACHAWC_004994 [Mediolabrus comicus]
MRRDFWNDIQKQRSDNNIGNTTSSATSFDVYHKIIQPGTYCTIHGHVGPSRNQKEAILFCTSLKYRLANNNPQHLRNVLKFVADGVLDVNEVLEALPTLSHEDELIPSSSTAAATSNQTYGELATQILDTFPPKFLLNPSQMMGSTDAAKVQLLPPVPHEFGTLPPIIITEVKEKVAVSDSLTISQALQQQKQEHDNGLVSITGWVQNRRRYQGSVSVLEVVDTFSSSFRAMNGDEDNDSNNNSNNINDSVNSKKLKEMWKERIYAVIHPDALCSEEMAEMYGNLLSAGARFMIEGFMTKSDDKDDEMPSFWVTRIRLLRSSWRQGEIRTLLDLVHEGKFLDIEEAARALNIPYSQAEELAEGTATPAERQWLAAEITMKLQGENSRVGKISNKMMESLSTFADERDRYPIQEERSRLAADGNSSQPVVSSILESNLGGKGLLSNLLAETFGEDIVDVQVIDISTRATNNGMMRARRHGLENIRFDAMDATKVDIQTKKDLIVALHACGALSDVALGHALCQGAGFVICPCCFNSNPHLRVSVPVKGGDVELVSADDFLRVDPESYTSLKQLAELQGDIKLASKAMHTIIALRAAAVDRLWSSSKRGSQEKIYTSIKTFPIGFSTRNFCLVGKYTP